MVEQIYNPLFSGPCESINNWDRVKHSFCDAAATLQAHEISKMTSQTKIAIDEEINSILLWKYFNKSRAPGEVKILCAFKLSG